METLVLVLTDVQGSTRLWHDEPSAMDAAMTRHHEIIHGAVERHGGFRPVDQGEGDAVFAAFRSPADAVAAVATIQRLLHDEPWPTSVSLRVRIGVHVGEVYDRGGNLFGDPVNRCARLRGLGAGGQTLLSAPVYELVRDGMPDGAELVDLGEHRMKDLTRPEHVWQLDLAGLPSDFPPLASLDRARHNLPVQLAPFIGREEELRGLAAAVRENRLVTLTGFGGMGKTRLALQTAAELVGDESTGEICFVDLSAVTDPALVAGRIAEAAGVLVGTQDPVQALVDRYRDAPCLVVLDNLEQVMGCAPVIHDLLSRTSGLRVLATSREPLHLRSEVQVALAPMGLPSAADAMSAEHLSTFEAVRFFVDRACAVRQDFTITNDTAPAVAAICVRLEGHPLALELAASRVKVLSPSELLRRLDSALMLLVGGSRDMPARHQTLRATIAWSYDALPPEEQLLLQRMAALPADASLEMIEHVSGTDLDVLSLIETLVERSLVRAVEVEDSTRFGLLGSVRDFVAEQLSPRDAEALRDRHAEFVSITVKSLFGWSPEAAGALYAFVDSEIAHVRAALERLLVPGREHDRAEMVSVVSAHLLTRGLVDEARLLAEQSLQGRDGYEPELVAVLLGVLCRAQDGLLLDPAAGREAQLAARTCSDPRVRARVLLEAMPWALPAADEIPGLLAELDDAIAQMADRQMILEHRNSIASHILRFVDPVAAEAAARAMDPMDNLARPVNLATVLLDRGAASEALDVLDRALAAVHVLSQRQAPTWHAELSSVRSRALLLLGRLDEATEQGAKTRSILVDAGLDDGWASGALAAVHRAAGRPREALDVLEHLCGSDPTQDWRIAVCMRELGRLGAAQDLLMSSREVIADDAAHGIWQMLAVLVELAVHAAADDPARAASLLGCVDAHRGQWVLPWSMDREIPALEAQLLPTYADDYEAGRSLDPVLAW